MTNAQPEGATFPIAEMPHYWESVIGGMWFKRCYDLLLDAMPKDRPSVWVECGVFHGQSICYLGVEVLRRQLPVTIHAVDSFQGWPGVAQGDALRESFFKNTAPIAAALGDRFQVHAMPSLQAAAAAWGDCCDVVWIDADHSYDAVKADIAAWWPKVKLGGYLGGDDWCMTGVAWAVQEAFGTDYQIVPGWREESAFTGPWPSWLKRRDVQ